MLTWLSLTHPLSSFIRCILYSTCFWWLYPCASPSPSLSHLPLFLCIVYKETSLHLAFVFDSHTKRKPCLALQCLCLYLCCWSRRCLFFQCCVSQIQISRLDNSPQNSWLEQSLCNNPPIALVFLTTSTIIIIISSDCKNNIKMLKNGEIKKLNNKKNNNQYFTYVPFIPFLCPVVTFSDHPDPTPYTLHPYPLRHPPPRITDPVPFPQRTSLHTHAPCFSCPRVYIFSIHRGIGVGEGVAAAAAAGWGREACRLSLALSLLKCVVRGVRIIAIWVWRRERNRRRGCANRYAKLRTYVDRCVPLGTT